MLSKVPPPFDISAAGGSVSSGTVVFSNSNGVSFGMNGSTLTGSVAAQTSPAFSAQGGSSTFNTLSFSNANGISFTNTNGQIGASYTVPTVTNSSWTVSDAATSGTVGRLAFTNLNGVTLSLSTGAGGSHTIVGSHNALTTADLSQNSSKYVQNWKLTGNTAGTTSSAQGTDLWISGGNSITVSGSSNSIVLSVGAYITTADLSQNSSNYARNWKLTGNTAGTTSSAIGTDLWIAGGNNITVSGSSNSITISGANVGGAQTGISSVAAAGGTQTVGMVSFVNSNGVTFGMSTGANTGTVTASVAAQSNQTVGLYGSSQTTGSASSGTYDARSITFIGAGIVSVGDHSTSAGGTTTGFIISATQSNQAFSAQGGSSAFQTLSFTNSNNVSFSNTNGSVWGSFALNVSATGGTSNALSGLTFKDSQGVSFGLSTGAGVGTITASVAAQSTQPAVNAFGVSNTGNTAGNTGTSSGITFVLAASNGLTLSQSTVGGGPNTAWLQVGAYLTTAALSGDTSKYMQNWKLTGNTSGTTSSAEGTDLWFSGGNSITVSGSSNSIVFSVGNYITTADLSQNSSNYVQAWELDGANTAGTTSSLQGTKLYLSGGNNITLSGNSNTIVISAPNLGAGAFSGGASNLGNTAGATGISGTQGVFVGTNMISLSQTTGANGFTLSFNATQSAQTLGLTVTGNSTVNSTTTLDARSITINASTAGAVSMGFSGGSLLLSAPQTSSLSATGAFSISTNGSTISMGVQPMDLYAVGNTFGTSSGTADLRTVSISAGSGLQVAASNSGWVIGQAMQSYFYNEILEQTQAFNLPSISQVYVQPFVLPYPISGGYVRMLVSLNDTAQGTAGTTSANVSFFCDIYSTFAVQVLSQGTGASSRSLTNVTSSSVGMTCRTAYTAGANGSQYTISVLKSYPASGTTSNYTSSYAVSSGSIVISSNSNTLFTGPQWLDVPFGVSLTPGAYWLAFGRSTQTSTNSSHISFCNTNTLGMQNIMITQNTLAPRPFGAVVPASDHQMQKGLGAWSTNSALFSTAGMGINSIASGGSNQVLGFQLIREA